QFTVGGARALSTMRAGRFKQNQRDPIRALCQINPRQIANEVTSVVGTSCRNTMSAPMSAVGGVSGLVMLTLSFVDHDPQRHRCCSRRIHGSGQAYRDSRALRVETTIMMDKHHHLRTDEIALGSIWRERQQGRRDLAPSQRRFDRWMSPGRTVVASR